MPIPRVTKKAIWLENAKFYGIILVLIFMSSAFGSVIGSIYTKKNFDRSSIESGHARYNETTGALEWRRCK